MLQVGVEQWNGSQIVVRQVQIHQCANIEYHLWEALVSQVVEVKSDKGQVREVLKIVLGNVLNVVPVQEQLGYAVGYICRHLPQDVVSQVKLYQIFKIFKDILG